MKTKGKNTNLQTAVIIMVCTAFVFLFLFAFLALSHRKDVYDNSKQMAMEISRHAAYETQIYLSSTIEKVRWLEEKARLLHKLNASRVEIDTLIKAAILGNNNYLGVWTLWEPNAFDGKDHLFKNDSCYNDQGTVGVAFFRENGIIYREVMVEADYAGEYYALPKKLMDELMVEPYRFRYSGYGRLYLGSTISVPIISNGVFLGAIGIDIDLGYLQEKLNKVRPYETGYLSLISNRGTILTHNDTSVIAQRIYKLLDENDTLSYRAIESGKEFEIETVSEFTGQDVFRLFYPIIVGKKSKPWSMMIEIPVAQAASLSKQVWAITISTLILGMSLLVYLLINVAERKRYEKAILDAKAKAEESDRLKSAFLNNISHEIRTPLNGMLGFIGLMFDENIEPEEKQDYKRFIENSSNQLLSTITSVVELSKIQSKEYKVETTEFNLESAIREVIANFKSDIQTKNLKLIENFPEQSNVMKSDIDKFKQILSHLLNNAIKFTDVGTIEVGYKPGLSAYMFYVKDSGIGIGPENLEDIFNNFRQEDISSSRKYGGLGIGLSIAKSFVHMLNGTIKVESELKKGSVFTFTLPRNIDD